MAGEDRLGEDWTGGDCGGEVSKGVAGVERWDWTGLEGIGEEWLGRILLKGGEI